MKPTIQSILEIIFSEKQATAKQLQQRLGVSQVLIHRHLKKCCEEGKIQKIGSSPKVFYVPKLENPIIFLPNNYSEIVENNWLEILPNGRFVYGNNGFKIWCQERNFNFKEKQEEYETMFKEKEKFKENGLIDATEKIKQSFEKNYLEKVWYIDFYSWEIFGKTLLGKLILYAKQNSDVVLMKKISDQIKKPLIKCLARENFNMISTIPHSIHRKKDFLSTTLSFLPLQTLPQKIFIKIFADHVVAQKTLKSKIERQKNAEETIFLATKNFPSKILLIDDACGSGATLNIAAKKIHEFSPNTRIFGLVFVGSLKGFEVIAES